MNATEQIIKKSIAQSNSRVDLWTHLLKSLKVKYVVEVGVYKGDLASKLLEKCDSIEKYYMVDPWRNLNSWNKPANVDDQTFEQFFFETKLKTDFAADKRIILRGKTTEVIEEISDGTLDFAYIDGDHTLKGITIDLIRVFPKIQNGGWIGGDDFSKTVWQHQTCFEPTMVFPFAVYFAEAVGAHIYALPYEQFLIEKDDVQPFTFTDLTGYYDDISLRNQFHPEKILKLIIKEKYQIAEKFARRAKLLISK